VAWPALAVVVVVAMMQPWHGEVNLPGIGFGALAATGWATRIRLTQRSTTRTYEELTRRC